MKRPLVVLAPGTCTTSAGRATVLAVALVALGGCVTTLHNVPIFSAYWYASSEVDPCPLGETCVAYAESFPDFEELRMAQRDRHLELVDFDARITADYEIYAGAWRQSNLAHDLLIGMSWGKFVSEHEKRSQTGQHLVSFKFYEDDGQRQVAAIWSAQSQKGSSGQVNPPTESVRPIASWDELKKEGKAVDGDRPRPYLDQIEVYEHPRHGFGRGSDTVNDPRIAGLWRAGTVETRVLEGLACDAEAEASAATIPGGSADAPPSARYSRCELMTTLYALNDEGFRAVDFETYTEDGVERWVVLLQNRHERDWLMFPARVTDVTYRDNRLKSAQVGNPFALFDLDILSVVPADPHPHQYHEGVAHDGSTSGPPP